MEERGGDGYRDVEVLRYELMMTSFQETLGSCGLEGSGG
jgi:hypothetical protein